MENVSALAAALDALLPQTQCTRCGFAGCRPYAEALAGGLTALNRCPPGGTATIQSLAARLRQPVLPLDPACGSEGPTLIAWIDAQRCIGCARCLPPCPTDAIVGAQRLLHTVLPDLCTGCELCVADCPVDCIVIRPRTSADGAPPTPQENRVRFQSHTVRAAVRDSALAELLAQRKQQAAEPGAAAEDEP
jgi:electron transport complex protein RnfB